MSCCTHASYQNADKIKAKIMSKLIKISLIILSLAFGHNIYAKGITEVVDHCNKSYRIGYEITDTGVVRKKPCITVSRGTATIIGHAAQTSSCRCRILNYKINKNKTRRQTTFDMYTSCLLYTSPSPRD